MTHKDFCALCGQTMSAKVGEEDVGAEAKCGLLDVPLSSLLFWAAVGYVAVKGDVVTKLFARIR